MASISSIKLPNGTTYDLKDKNAGTVTSVQVQASSPLQSSTSTAQSASLNTTISFTNQSANVVLAGPSSGSTAAAPTFRSLVAADIPNLAWSKITSGNDDLKAIQNLTGTSGLLKKTAANTWTLDTTSYSTLTIGTTATTAAAGNHTHTTSIATSTGTNQITLAHGTKYALSAGGTSYVFTMPSDSDEKIKLTSQATSGTYPLLFGPTSITSNSTYQGYYNTGITVNPSTKTITATTFSGALSGTATGNITSVQYDSTNNKFTYTKNNSNTDIVTINNLKTYLELGEAAYKNVDTVIDDLNATDDKVPTSKAVKDYLEETVDYYTPQMFGAKADGSTDDTLAIQQALDAGLNIFFPSGTYVVSYPLYIRNGTHLKGTSTSSTILKAASNFSYENMPNKTITFTTTQVTNVKPDGIGDNKLQPAQLDACRYRFSKEPEVGNFMMIIAECFRSQYANEASNPNTTSSVGRPSFTKGNVSSFILEGFTLSCNDVSNVNGLRIMRPYNRCSLKDIFVDNCVNKDIFVGDTMSVSYMQSNYNQWVTDEGFSSDEGGDPGLEARLRRRTRSQTLMIENCHFMGSKTGTRFTPTTSYSGVQYKYTYWRPNTHFQYSWQLISDIYLFSNTSDYNKVTTTTKTFTLPVSGGTESYTHNKIEVGGNKWISNQTSYLAHFYNSFEMNVKDTKFQYYTSNFKMYPCAVFDNCTDLYVRGCSFSGTLGEAVRITGGSKYFRFIGNTYELIGRLDTDSGLPTGGGFAAAGLHNMYSTSGDFSSSFITERNYLIDCRGQDGKTLNGGIIIETTYNNTPREVRLRYTNNILIIGTFKQNNETVSDKGTVLIDSLTGKIQSDDFNTREFAKYYTITTSTSATGGPFSYVGYSSDLSSDISNYGKIVGITVTRAGGGQAIATFNSTTNKIELYANYNSRACQVRAVFCKNPMS